MACTTVTGNGNQPSWLNQLNRYLIACQGAWHQPTSCLPAGYALAEIGLWLELERDPTICANLDWAHFDLLTDGLVKAAGCEA